jgi:hypothetical protein
MTPGSALWQTAAVARPFEDSVPQTARLVAALLALALATAQGAPAAAPGDPVRVEVAGPGRDVVRLVDATTGVLIASDRLRGEPVRGSVASPDNAAVAVRYGAGGEGDAIAVYAIDWRVDPASGAKTGKVVGVLAYQPRDGYLGVSLLPVPAGSVLRVQSGRNVPLWNKVFLLDRRRGTWLEWPRALAPDDATAGVPRAVGDAASGEAYAAWVRPLAPAD